MSNLRINLMITQRNEEKREECCNGEETEKKIEIGEVPDIQPTNSLF